MNRKQALTELMAKVEAGEYNGAPFTYHINKMVTDAYHGSLDAAKALHEAVLGCDWSVSIELGAAFWDVTLTHYPWVERDRMPDWNFIGELQDNPARAWLIAIIEALIAQEGAS